jgi:probable HAF family extracellular repeat protein
LPSASTTPARSRGRYFANGNQAFLLSGGTCTTLNVPGASGFASANGINGSGQIVGQYQDASGGLHGYLLSGGTYTSLDPPGSNFALALGINDAGQIVGEFSDTQTTHGFLLSGGVYTTLDVPGAGATELLGINDAGQIVGAFTDANGRQHGFLATPVPEPAAFTLFSLGLIGFLGCHRGCRATRVQQ